MRNVTSTSSGTMRNHSRRDLIVQEILGMLVFKALKTPMKPVAEHSKMSMMLGKRKRRNEVLVGKKRAGAEMEQIVVEEESSGSEAELDAQEIFRRHFEAQFEPLPELKKARHLEDKDFETEDSDEDGDDWEGISEEGISCPMLRSA